MNLLCFIDHEHQGKVQTRMRIREVSTGLQGSHTHAHFLISVHFILNNRTMDIVLKHGFNIMMRI